jgi:hypothetical protein
MNALLRYALIGLLAALLASCGGDVAAPASGVGATTDSGQRASTVTGAAAYTTVLQQVYVAYFGRPADPAGMAYFAARFQDAGAPTTIQAVAGAYFTNPALRAQIDSFGTSQESRDLYPCTNEHFIRAVYRNLLNRDADAGGLAYWAGQLTSGTLTRGNAAMSIMAGAQGTDITIILNKTAVATAFSNALDTPAKLAAYSGLTANAFVRNVIGSVGLTTNVADFQASVTTTISTLVAGIPLSTKTPLVWEQASNWDSADWQ